MLVMVFLGLTCFELLLRGRILSELINKKQLLRRQEDFCDEWRLTYSYIGILLRHGSSGDNYGCVQRDCGASAA